MVHQINPKTIDLIVDRIAASGILGTSERQLALLRYLLAEELGGRGENLKAYSIGTDVLGRSPRFDPGQDAIVRVEVGRLRKSLDLYFATAGRVEPLRIVIEKGNYRPQFVENVPESIAPPPAFATSAALSGAEDRRSAKRWPQIALWIAVAALVVAEVIHLAMSFAGRGGEARIEENPRLVIAMPDVAGLGEHSATVRFSLQAALAQELRNRAWLSVSIGEQTTPHTRTTFTLRPALSAAGERWAMTALLTREPNREVVWTGRYDGHDNILNPDTLRQTIATAVNRDLGPLTGPIAEAVAIQSEVTKPDTTTPFGCIVNIRRFLRQNTQRQFADSKACVIRLSQLAPSVIELRALLTYLLLLEAVQPNLSPLPTMVGGTLITDRETRREALLHEAEVIQRGASPTERIMLQQRMLIAACRGDMNAVREQLPQLLSFESKISDPYIVRAVLLGPVLGEWESALKSEATALSLTANPSPRYQIVSGLYAGINDNPVEALRLLTRAPMHSYPVGQLLVGMFAAEAGSPLHVKLARQELRELGYRDEAAFEGLIKDSCYSNEVKARLLIALKAFIAFKAG